jgi:hypothetical protein
MATHEQVWVKVNAPVDKGMARIVSALNSVDGLQTLQSCQGSAAGEAYIYFSYGSWDKTARLVFEGIVPALESSGTNTTGVVEVFNGSLPIAKISFDAAVLEKATAAIESFISTSSGCVHNSASAHDREYRAQVY